MANEHPTDKTSQPNDNLAGAVLSSDTSFDAERLQVRLWRRMSPLEKAHSVSEISRAVEDLSLLGIRRRHPGATDRECKMRLAMLKLGRELASQVYPETVALSGN